MSRDKEYSDHLTLRAAADLYNVNIIVVSTLGPERTVIISPLHFNAYGRICLGHFAEGQGEHYISLSPQEELNELINENFEESMNLELPDVNSMKKLRVSLELSVLFLFLNFCGKIFQKQ